MLYQKLSQQATKICEFIYKKDPVFRVRQTDKFSQRNTTLRTRYYAEFGSNNIALHRDILVEKNVRLVALKRRMNRD
jgi:hypothetical protein